jgi:protein TonB
MAVLCLQVPATLVADRYGQSDPLGSQQGVVVRLMREPAASSSPKSVFRAALTPRPVHRPPAVVVPSQVRPAPSAQAQARAASQSASPAPGDHGPDDATQAVGAGSASGPSLAYLKVLFQHIQPFLQYPDAARAGRLHGSVQLLVALNRGGTVVGVWVRTSSGSMILDKEAVETVRRAQPLPPVPPELPDVFYFFIPIDFAAPPST